MNDNTINKCKFIVDNIFKSKKEFISIYKYIIYI